MSRDLIVASDSQLESLAVILSSLLGLSQSVERSKAHDNSENTELLGFFCSLAPFHCLCLT